MRPGLLSRHMLPIGDRYAARSAIATHATDRRPLRGRAPRAATEHRRS